MKRSLRYGLKSAHNFLKLVNNTVSMVITFYELFAKLRITTET